MNISDIRHLSPFSHLFKTQYKPQLYTFSITVNETTNFKKDLRQSIEDSLNGKGKIGHSHLAEKLSHENALQAARKRIVLASLYLGTGPKEERLLECVEESLKDGSSVEVKVLLDYSRGNRLAKGKSSKTMLAPLVQKYPNVSAYFYHTPVLRGLKKKLMPTKYAETMGVQHCKVYLFDDWYG